MFRKQKEELEKELKRSKQILSNENFIKKAPESKINEEKEKYENYKKQYEALLKEME